MHATCSICAEPLSVRTIERSSGIARGIAVEVVDLPFLSCSSEHSRRWCDPNFGDKLLDALVDALPLARSGSKLLRRRLRCTACRADLNRATLALESFGAAVELDSAPSFRLELQTAALTCRDCGKIQLAWGAAEGAALAEAVTEAVFTRPRLEP